MAIGPNSGLTDALATIVTTTHEEVALADLTDWQWDELIVFVEGAPASEINAAAGQPIMTGSYNEYLGEKRLLLFMDEGTYVCGVTTYMALLFPLDGTHQFTNAVRVVPVESQTGGWNLRLLEPGDNP